jgi:hypothetical protein
MATRQIQGMFFGSTHTFKARNNMMMCDDSQIALNRALARHTPKPPAPHMIQLMNVDGVIGQCDLDSVIDSAPPGLLQKARIEIWPVDNACTTLT